MFSLAQTVNSSGSEFSFSGAGVASCCAEAVLFATSRVLRVWFDVREGWFSPASASLQQGFAFLQLGVCLSLALAWSEIVHICQPTGRICKFINKYYLFISIPFFSSVYFPSPHVYSSKTNCRAALGCGVGTLSTHKKVCCWNSFVVFIETLPTRSFCFPNTYKSLQGPAQRLVMSIYVVILSRVRVKKSLGSGQVYFVPIFDSSQVWTLPVISK